MRQAFPCYRVLDEVFALYRFLRHVRLLHRRNRRHQRGYARMVVQPGWS